MSVIHAHFPSCTARSGGKCIGCEWRRYALSAFIALSFGTGEYIAGKMLVSVAAQGDAIHLFGDAFQSGISTTIALLAFYHKKSEDKWRSRGGYIQALCIALAGVVILYEALYEPSAPRSGSAMILLGAIATAVALVRIRIVHAGWDFEKTTRETFLAIRKRRKINPTALGELFHIFLDVATSLAVLLAGIGIVLASNTEIDRVAALYVIAPVAFLSAIAVVVFAHHEHHH